MSLLRLATWSCDLSLVLSKAMWTVTSTKPCLCYFSSSSFRPTPSSRSFLDSYHSYHVTRVSISSVGRIQITKDNQFAHFILNCSRLLLPTNTHIHYPILNLVSLTHIVILVLDKRTFWTFFLKCKTLIKKKASLIIFPSTSMVPSMLLLNPFDSQAFFSTILHVV